MAIRGFLSKAPRIIHREIFQNDVRRVIRVGWLVIALSTAINLLLLPGGINRWQLNAVAIIVASCTLALLLEKRTRSSLPFALVPIVLLILPIVFAEQSNAPWTAYGLVIIPAIIHATAIEDFRISLLIIYVLTFVQYVVSKLNYPSISDNIDNQLLSSYFATSWSVIVGMGALLVRRAYLKYYDEIEATVEKVNDLQIAESQKLSSLNLRDHLNGKLHGTVLNTLIALKNSPMLLANKALVKKYISEDLNVLHLARTESVFNLNDVFDQESSLAIHRDLEVIVNESIVSEIDPLVYEVVTEIIRELVLNIKKHTSATECVIFIDEHKRNLNEDIETSIYVRELIIRVEDNSPLQAAHKGEAFESEFRSESVSRLLRSIGGDIKQGRNGDTFTQEISIQIPEEHQTYLMHVSTLRAESIKYLSKGFIALTLVYGIVSFPGYLYLNLAPDIALLFFFQITLLLLSFRVKRFALLMATLGSIIAISIFPLLSFKPLVCQEIQYLPWIFNGILGSAFFVTLLVNSPLLKWVPIVSFFFSSLVIQEKLPEACKNLLAGSIPAIALIAFIAFGFIVARNKSRRAQEVFVAESMSAYRGIESTRELVETERHAIIAELESFDKWIDSKGEDVEELSRKISSLILCLRSFLLTSEYFDAHLALYLYRFSLHRNLQGVDTRLEISTDNFALAISHSELERIFTQLEKVTQGVPIDIQVSRGDFLDISIVARTEKTLTPVVLQSGVLRVQVIQSS